ncbi:MAG: T9SS type A sorting domain-containing protein [Bacteroidia bacterium]|nr:T9SS type A sorting domain-containing protein [Bacteroidia bacterium]
MTVLTSLVYGICATFATTVGIALDPSDLSISLTSGPSLLVDNNKGCDEEPHAAYVSFEVCNNGSSDLSNVTARLEDFTNANFGLAAGQLADQTIGLLSAGDCKSIFWYIYYDCSSIGASSDLSIKLFEASGDTASLTETLTTVSTIDAGAGGTIIGTELLAGVGIGDTVEVEMEYSIGSTKAGNPVIIQPAGNLDFDADCYQLVSSIVEYSEVTEILVGDEDQLYYSSVSKHTGNSHTFRLKYRFVSNCVSSDSTHLRGYSAAVSGANMKRYNVGDEVFSSGPTLDLGWEDLEVQKQGLYAQISWKQTSNDPEDLLQIERSLDSRIFQNIYTAPYIEFKQKSENYLYRDKLSAYQVDQKIYYRLKHTNINGESSYSSILELQLSENSSDPLLYPNPANDYLTINLQGPDWQGGELRLCDIYGKVLLQSPLKEGESQLQLIPLQQLPSGKYFIQILHPEYPYFSSFVKK